MHRRVLVVLVVIAATIVVIVAGSASFQRDAFETAGMVGSSPTTFGDGLAAKDAPASAPLPSLPPRSEAVPLAGARVRAGGTASARSAESWSEGEPPAVALPGQAQQAGSMLIRSGQATVEVDSVDVGIARVRQLAQRTGAIIANTVVQTGREQRRSASLQLRVPSDSFDSVVNGLTPIGKVESVHINVDDVGEEFVDLTARLANARRLEARLIELLARRTGRLTDVLTVERELARIREQIERYEGRLRYLQSRVAVSSLTVTVHEPAPVVATHPGENVIAEAFVEAWRRFVRIVAGFIASLGVLIPLAGVGLGAYAVWRRYQPRKAMAVEQA
jgi:hypothetical protein